MAAISASNYTEPEQQQNRWSLRACATLFKHTLGLKFVSMFSPIYYENSSKNILFKEKIKERERGNKK